MKDRLLSTLITLLILLVLVQLFLPSQKDEITPTDIVKVQTKKKYTIPASVKIDISNYLDHDFEFNTCNDVSIIKDSRAIDHKDSECYRVNIPNGSKYTLDLSDKFNNFKEVGVYFIKLQKDDIEVISQFEVKHRGALAKIFIFLFYAPIYNLMAILLTLTNYSLGYAIIIITIIIRLIILVPQHKMMKNQAELQKLQPKIKEIQEKYKGNQQQIGMELMALYKKEGVSPMGSCGMLLIQMPILLVLYRIILGIQNESNEYYLYSFIGDFDIHKIQDIFFGVDLLGIGGINGVILAIIIGTLQFLQIKLSMHFTKKRNEKDSKPRVIEKKKNSNSYRDIMPDPEVMNKFMLVGMPIMIGIFTYNFYAGIGIYWGISTSFMIVQQLVVNKAMSSKKV